MKRFEKFRSVNNYKIPRIKTMHFGYKGLKKGLCVLWNGKGLVLIRPINERGN